MSRKNEEPQESSVSLRVPNFIGEDEPSTTFETFFGEEDPDVAEQLRLIAGRKSTEERNIALDRL